MSFLAQDPAQATKIAPTPEQEIEWEFAEIWVDSLISPPYILMLVKEQSGKFCIHNPAENYKVIFTSDRYEDAKMWLLEDEYQRLNSRVLPAQ